MLNTIFMIIICVGLPYILITAAFDFLGTAYGYGVMVLCFVALFLYLKPKIYTIMGRRAYFKNHDDGFKWMQKAYDTGKMNPQQGLIYAYLMIRDGHIDKAEKLISAIIYKNKKELTEQNLLAAELNRAIILWKRNKLAEAIKTLEELYDKGYRSTVFYGTLGVFYILSNNLERAEEFCKEAVEYNSDDMSIADNLGFLFVKQKKYDKAEDVYKKLFENGDPDFTEAYYNYGTVLEKKGEYKRAAECYNKALGCPEKYLSVIKHDVVENALCKVEEKLN